MREDAHATQLGPSHPALRCGFELARWPHDNSPRSMRVQQKPTWSKAAALARKWDLTQLAKRLEQFAASKSFEAAMQRSEYAF